MNNLLFIGNLGAGEIIVIALVGCCFSAARKFLN